MQSRINRSEGDTAQWFASVDNADECECGVNDDLYFEQHYWFVSKESAEEWVRQQMEQADRDEAADA